MVGLFVLTLPSLSRHNSAAAVSLTLHTRSTFQAQPLSAEALQYLKDKIDNRTIKCLLLSKCVLGSLALFSHRISLTRPCIRPEGTSMAESFVILRSDRYFDAMSDHFTPPQVAQPMLPRPWLPFLPARSLSLMMLRDGWATVYRAGGAQYGKLGVAIYDTAEADAKCISSALPVRLATADITSQPRLEQEAQERYLVARQKARGTRRVQATDGVGRLVGPAGDGAEAKRHAGRDEAALDGARQIDDGMISAV